MSRYLIPAGCPEPTLNVQGQHEQTLTAPGAEQGTGYLLADGLGEALDRRRAEHLLNQVLGLLALPGGCSRHLSLRRLSPRPRLGWHRRSIEGRQQLDLSRSRREHLVGRLPVDR